MPFVMVPGTKVLFCIWDVRVQDYGHYSNPRIDWNRMQPFMNDKDMIHPVAYVSWHDAKAFCAWLSQKERAEGRLGAGLEYRLPTDAEWSYAVGIGDQEGDGTPSDKNGKLQDVYPWGNHWPPPKDVVNYDQSLHVDTYPGTSPVGSFKPNQFGLYDMGGNVWQWCEDWFDAKQQYRVLRGGSWGGYYSRDLLASFRNSSLPNAKRSNCGFRVVVAPTR
ncbi:MAG: SUMF1/EgtB/PvdO family nonheme iron enzyme [Verrucomicrobiota bacterium]